MPSIKPFCALMPAKGVEESVVTRPLENYSAVEIAQISANNQSSFLHLINPELGNPYLRATKQDLIYIKISENLETFIEQGSLVKDSTPAIYIYQVMHDGLIQTGIWTLTHIEEYLQGTIKKHESTVARREMLLADYLQQTGMDANPVLITYSPSRGIESLIGKYLSLIPDIDFILADASRHQVWSVKYEQDLHDLIREFEAIPFVYIADGHHRIASMAKMAQHKSTLNIFKHTGEEAYNYFSTVYMSTEEVKVLEFNRLVKDLAGLTKSEFLRSLGDSFVIEKTFSLRTESIQLHTMGMYLDGDWYNLMPKEGLFNVNDPVSVLDVSILQNYILSPLLKIKDPRSDTRISFEGGRTSHFRLEELVDNGIYAVAFKLFPVSVDQVIAVADAQGVMPPKSTWVEPKFLTGLLTNYFN